MHLEGLARRSYNGPSPRRLGLRNGRQSAAESPSPAAMRYLVFVLFLVLAVVFAHVSHQGVQERIGDRLVLAAATALQLDGNGEPRDARFRDVDFEVSHLDIVLSGRIASPQVRAELVQLIREGSSIGRVRYERLQLQESQPPELAAIMVPGKVTIEGRVPSESLAHRLRQAFLGMGVFVTAQNLKVDDQINTEDWLNQADTMLARFFRGAKEGEFVLKDGVLRLKRTVTSPADIDLLRVEMGQWLPQGRYQVALDGVQVQEVARPSELALRKVDGRWLLQGQLPDQPSLDSIARVIQEADPQAQVDSSSVNLDNALMRPKWLQNGRIERFLRVFVRKVTGSPEILIRADRVILKGTATDFIARSNLPSSAGEAFGYGVEIDHDAVRLASDGQDDPSKWLRFDVNAESVVVAGLVPSDQARQDLCASLARAYPGAQLKDAALGVDASLPAMPFLPALGAYFADLASLTFQRGSVDLSGREAYLGGMAKSEWSRSALVLKLEQALGPDFQVYDQLMVDPRGESAAPGEAIRIQFGLGSRQIGADQEPKLLEAVDRIRRSGAGDQVLALVKGYASPGGSVEYNIKLSEARAVAVYDALIARGVSPKVLKILSEGVDPNLTGEEARRVEIYIR